MTSPHPSSPGEDPGGAPVLAVDIGGTKTTAAVVTAGHRVTAAVTEPTPAEDGGPAVLATALRLARQALAEAAAVPVAVGVGSAGVVDAAGRTVTAATSALPGWAGTPVADAFEGGFGVPATVLGDVQAFLAGELAAGAARGCGSAVAVMAGTGIGGAVAVGGAVVRGAHGAAGHLGHVGVGAAAGLVCPCGAAGHVEAVASGPAMAVRARGLLPDRSIAGLPDVSALARAGVAEARQVLFQGGAALGAAVAGVVSVLDPEVVVLGGGVLASGPWFPQAVADGVRAHTLPSLAGVRVSASSLGGAAVLVGAAAEARRPVTRHLAPSAGGRS
ncbi:ROK family protein [Streptomyces sp. NPDC020983]|uniref:ROK family protein n=1 Tax=Streptomyces sp. NPDC020983 TaxID=3365106 RepID=UPI0037B31D02